MRRLAPWPVDWLNPAEAIARHGLSLMQGVEPDDPNLEEFDDLALMTKTIEDRSMRRLLTGFGLRVLSLN